MRKSKFTLWVERNYPDIKDNSLRGLSKYFKISGNILSEVFNLGVGAYNTNYSAVRPSVKKVGGESAKQMWARARVNKLIKNVIHYRKGEMDKIPKGRGSDFYLVEKAGKANKYIP